MTPSAPPTTPKQVESFHAYLQTHAQGRANAKTARQLAHALHLGRNGDRLLRALAQKATARGLLVCTGNEGYWLPTTPEEAEATIGRIASQGQKMLQRAQELRALVAKQFAVTPSRTSRRSVDPHQLRFTL